jgi:1-deoxy-D-xylulose-5-phosphate reductoisomerase
MKKISILGSTGSIGTQALEIVREHSDKFSVEVLTAGNNSELLIKQALEFKPKYLAIANESKYAEVADALMHTNIKVFAGRKATEDIAGYGDSEMVLTAMVGYAGMIPTINAVKAKKDIALANKETLVVAGEIISNLAKEYGVNIYPVDSEHSAIFQCLTGEKPETVEKIILTASGGPFRTKSKAFMDTAGREQALKHPNWDMGAKISIDSASMMNKGLEAIEAKWLFGLKPEQIDIIVHPQSIIHSLVQFIDGSMKAQMGLPDMKHPILYAFTYPERIEHKSKRFNFTDYPELNFEKPDFEKFKTLKIAYEAMHKGGNMPCVINSANEAAVDAFLNDRIRFSAIADIIEESAAEADYIEKPSLSELINTHETTLRTARKKIKNLSS